MYFNFQVFQPLKNESKYLSQKNKCFPLTDLLPKSNEAEINLDNFLC